MTLYLSKRTCLDFHGCDDEKWDVNSPDVTVTHLGSDSPSIDWKMRSATDWSHENDLRRSHYVDQIVKRRQIEMMEEKSGDVYLKTKKTV